MKREMKNLGIIGTILVASLSFYGCKKDNDVLATPDRHTVGDPTVSIPLYVTSILPGQVKVGIKLALGNSGIPKIYEFDTGSEGFFAAYQPGINWWPAASITSLTGSQKAPMKYGSNTEFNFQLVKTNVLFEGGTSLDATIGKIISSDKSTNPFQYSQGDWTSKVLADQPQLYNRFYGIFGAALYLGNGSTWSGPDLLATPLGQFNDARGDGFIVRLNSSFDSPDNTQVTPTDQLIPNGELQLGITDDLRDQFPIKLPMIPYQNPVINGFPNGNPFYEEHSVSGKIKVTDASGNTTSLPVYILFDSGATSIGLTTNYTDPSDSPIAPFLSGGKLIEGTNVTITVNGIDLNSGWRWNFKAGHDIPTNMVTAKNTPSSGNKIFLVVNQAAFFRNDFMFDLRNGIIGLAPK